MVKDRLKAIPGLAATWQWAWRRKWEYEYRRVLHPETVRAAVARYLAEIADPKLHIGAGWNLLPGWLNTDLEPTSPGLVYLDATQPFPLPDASFTHVFSEHMIEHVSFDGGMAMLKECRRILRPGGRIRIATPNLTKLIEMFASQKSDVQQRYLDFAGAEYFPEIPIRNECVLLNAFVRKWGHQFVYDPPTLQRSLEMAGFTDVAWCEVGSSEDAELRGKERHGARIGEQWNVFETMVIEARKPDETERTSAELESTVVNA